MKTESIDSVVVSGGILGDLLGVTERRIRQLAEEGVLVRVSKGRYSLAGSVKSYLVHLKTNRELKEKEPSDDLDWDKEKAMHERIKREMAEMKLAQMRGELHLAGDVEQVMNDMLASFRTKILAMPSKLAPLLIARDDVNQIRSFVEKECMEALEELARYDPEKFYSGDYIDLDDEVMEADEEEEAEDQAEDD